ncbi:MAG: hypothetical protein J6T45_02495 [Fibrobacterales bacterium]|nr:hypothetical protein [Fibrobacterales bacterium]
MRLKSFAALSALTLVFVGCGDDITEKTVVGTQWVDAIADEECTVAKTGLIAYSKDDGSSWYCDGEKWTTLDGAKGKKGPQGEKGEAGDDGKNGKKGEDCTLVQSGDPGVAKIACKGDTVEVAQSERGTFVDARDNHVYGWTRIGRLIVMSQNLDYGRKVDAEFGSIQPEKTKWCPRDSASYCNVYGGYYQWVNAMGLPDSCAVKSCADQWKFADDSVYAASPYYWEGGICPAGWHLTNEAEWNYIEWFADQATGGRAVVRSRVTLLAGEDDGFDLFGFAALRAGNAYDGLEGSTEWHIPAESAAATSKEACLGATPTITSYDITKDDYTSVIPVRCTMNYADTSAAFADHIRNKD